jgi:AraC-like DNA-binding protein
MTGGTKLHLSVEERPSDSPFVERVWHGHSESAGSFISIAALHWEMVVSRHNGVTSLTVRGPETKPTVLDYSAGAEWFGIDFKLGAFMPHLPPEILSDHRDVNLPNATGQSFWLHGSTWQFPTYENVDAFVARLVREGLLVRDPVVETTLQGQPQELAIRAIQTRFVRATGLTQRAIQQIKRARHAAALLRSGVQILDTVHEAGYFDQPHLTKSLKRFIGVTPAHIGDAQISLLGRHE